MSRDRSGDDRPRQDGSARGRQSRGGANPRDPGVGHPGASTFSEIVPPWGPTLHPKKILHPTDYSETSRPALMESLSLAQEHQARLVILHVVDSLGPENLTFGESTSADQPDAYRRELFEKLRHVLPPDTHVHVDCVLSEEELVTAILRTQAEFGCDLIVLG